MSDEFIRNDALIIKIVFTKKPNTPWLSDLRFTNACVRTSNIHNTHQTFHFFTKIQSLLKTIVVYTPNVVFVVSRNIENYNKLRKKVPVSLCSYSRHFGFTEPSNGDTPSVCIARPLLILDRLCWNFIRCYCNLVDSTSGNFIWIPNRWAHRVLIVGRIQLEFEFNSILTFMLKYFYWRNRIVEIKSHNLESRPNHVMYVINSKNRVFKEFAKSRDFVHSPVSHLCGFIRNSADSRSNPDNLLLFVHESSATT